MKTIALVLAFASAGVAAGCTTTSSEQEPSTSAESSIRAMTPEEIMGELAYGESKDVDFTPAPKYRAFSFVAERNDTIQATVTSLDGTDPVLWLTDESFNTLALNNDARPTDTSSLISRQLPKAGKYFLVFREMNFAPRAKFTVSVKKTGSLPVECDPDSEGFSDPECTTPLGVDPFDPASCAGDALTAADATAKLGTAGGVGLADSKIYYKARQCSIASDGAEPVCSPWVRSFLMDVPLAKVVANATTPNNYTFLASTSRTKVKVDFFVEPGGMKQLCVDGPFASLREGQGDTWINFEDGTPGVCTIRTASPAAITSTCARFEPQTIQIKSDDATRYTEYKAVLLARY